MPTRVQLIFKHPSGYGWSEDYYTNRSVADLNAGQFNNLRDARLGLLASDCTLVRARLSHDFYRNPDTIIVGSPDVPNGQGPAAASADFVRILVQVQAQVSYGRIYLGGVPQTWAVGDKLQVNDAGFLKAMSALRLVMIGSPGQWGLKTTNSAGKKPYFSMVGAIRAIPRGFFFNSPDFPFGSFPTQIYVKGSTIPGYNGIKTVIQADSSVTPTKYLCGGATPPSDAIVNDLMLFSVQAAEFSQCIDVQPVEITERRSGRPFGQRVGRRRNQIPLRQ